MRLLPLAATLALLLLAPPAGASVVSYLDGGDVWRAALDGSRKLKLSGPPTVSGHEWRESAQADNGRVIAVSRPDGKISTINTFTLWGPDGAIVHQGILQDNGSWTLPAFPVSLDLNAGGTTAVYGYSNTTGSYPTQVFERGTYVMPVDKAWAIEAFKIVDETWPTIVGNRVVSAAGTTVNVQAPAGQPPYSTDFIGWLDASNTAGAELNRTDVAANGTIAAIELVAWDGGTQTDGVIAMLPVPGLGQNPTAGDCFLPTQGVAGEVSVSQDAKSVAWHDDRGVVVAGTPNFAATGADSLCVLTRAPVVISATGTEPSLGGTSLPVQQQPPPQDPDPEPGDAAGPSLALAAKVKASALKKGLKLKVTVAAAGTVKATGKVGGKLVARGSRKATAAGTVTVRLKATKKAAKKLKKLRGKKLKIKVTAGGKSATITRKLR